MSEVIEGIGHSRSSQRLVILVSNSARSWVAMVHFSVDPPCFPGTRIWRSRSTAKRQKPNEQSWLWLNRMAFCFHTCDQICAECWQIWLEACNSEWLRQSGLSGLAVCLPWIHASAGPGQRAVPVSAENKGLLSQLAWRRGTLCHLEYLPLTLSYFSWQNHSQWRCLSS